MTRAPTFEPDSLALTAPFPSDRVRRLRRASIFAAGKLDPQAFDRPALAPCAIRVAPSAARALAAHAESLAAEMLEFERAVADDRRALRALSLPRTLVESVRRSARAETPSVRFARVDFHPTADGWRVSEINADVPGGFIEAGAITALVAREFEGVSTPPEPAGALAAAIARALTRRTCGAAGAEPRVALVHATAFTDDQQVMRALAAALERRGVPALYAAPDHLAAGPGDSVTHEPTGRRVDAILRFFPGEWLANLPRARAWPRIAASSELLQANPLAALVTQSKRFALALDAIGADAPTWRALVPRARAIGARRFARRLAPQGWVLKPVWGRVGGGIVIDGATRAPDVRVARRSARLFPRHWVLQERFDSRAIAAPESKSGEEVPLHACLGVFVIDGRASGIYARLSERPLIDSRAMDASVLIDPTLEPVPSPSRAQRRFADSTIASSCASREVVDVVA